MTTKITTTETKHETSEAYTEMLRRIPTYPGVTKWISEVRGDGEGYHTTIEFESPEVADLFLVFEGPAKFTSIL